MTRTREENAADMAHDEMVRVVEAAGWAWDEPAQEWRLNDTGEGFDAVARTVEEAMFAVRHERLHKPIRPLSDAELHETARANGLGTVDKEG